MRCSHAMEAKRLLRSRLFSARAQRPGEAREAAGERIAGHGLDLWRDIEAVAAYAAFGTEPPTRRLLDDLADAGVRVLLPVVAGTVLDWARYDGWAELVPGRRGVLEPGGRRLGPRAVDDVTVVVVPALAVDREGHRLGRGAGYYDRTLAAVDPARVVAVVYDEEVLDEIPVEPHDRRVGAALTPGGYVELGDVADAQW